jgi:peptidoglycan/xylan/chitin deacetylase (PgdA/CDA1 family)
VTTIACDQLSCSGQYYRPVTITFSATGGKSGGSQVMHTYYTTDGSTPTVSSTIYSGPFKVSKPTTLKFFTSDAFGNAGLVKTQQIEVATGAGRANPRKPEQFKLGQTVVSFTFDDAYENTWLYSIPLLQAHHMTATYYVITIDQDLSHKCCMSWAQLDDLQSRGNDIGGHTITHPNLSTLSRAQMRQEICGNRQQLIQHGIPDPRSFAYPFGVYNATAESVVRQCGFTTAREGGGISGSNTIPGPPYAETIPPRNPYVLRTIAVDAAKPEKLADLKAYVSATAAHGGGWLVITFHDVCNAKAADYTVCMAKYGSIEDTVFGQFLNWLQSAGQPGGAPSEVLVRNVCQVMNCP